MGETAPYWTRWLLGVVWQDGGQRRARRNAWQAMLADRARARDRAEAEAALSDAGTRTTGTVGSASPATPAFGEDEAALLG